MHENGIFLTPVKHTLVSRAPWVSWAARHTTMCLDFGELSSATSKERMTTNIIFVGTTPIN